MKNNTSIWDLQDNYSNGKLHFGSPKQQDYIFNLRWESVMKAISINYPELALLMNDPLFKIKIFTILKKTSFKDRHQLFTALNYHKFKNISNHEFKIFLKRFKKYLDSSQSEIEFKDPIFNWATTKDK